MNRWTIAGATVAGLVAAGMGMGARAEGNTAAMGGPMTVHEWGTFTNFSTSDGVQRAFGSPIGSGAGLPGFVVGFKNVGGGGASGEQEAISGWKELLVAKQRMETPVIYIYPGCEEKATIEARILDGQMTEFYPPLNGVGGGREAVKKGAEHSVVRWENIKLQNGDDVKPPKQEDGSHYFEARATDAAMLSVDALGAKHNEKFLFYRGAADFDSKVTLRALGKDRFEIGNATGEKIPAAYVVSIGKGTVRWTAVGEVGAKKEGVLAGSASTIESLAGTLQGALVKAGLFEKEASAMVATWRKYWFEEEGTRVLYIMPKGEVERVLPLKVSPTPGRIERVFVGRMDISTPETEGQITEVLAAMDGKPDEARASVWERMPKLGRFLGPAVKAVAERSKDPKMIAAAQRAGY